MNAWQSPVDISFSSFPTTSPFQSSRSPTPSLRAYLLRLVTSPTNDLFYHENDPESRRGRYQSSSKCRLAQGSARHFSCCNRERGAAGQERCLAGKFSRLPQHPSSKTRIHLPLGVNPWLPGTWGKHQDTRLTQVLTLAVGNRLGLGQPWNRCLSCCWCCGSPSRDRSDGRCSTRSGYRGFWIWRYRWR